ncbi:MAG: type IIA DNA topoisomerase subunit B [Candidatus Eremiobacteraeota bacterium]|nr:type IIA DNA topoisomerase subunit B [Candidatus Eremiobacteraeota bacterium]
MSAASSYSASDITVLTGLEPVRKRPHMYIGSTDEQGLHHLVWEIVDNSIDEVMNGFASFVEVELQSDGSTIRVTDNGRGIPVDIHPESGKPALELILTTLHAGGKFEGGNYTFSGGLHGVGASVVNALALNLVAEVKRDGILYRQTYSKGIPDGPLEEVGEARGTGTAITFTPDPEIFPNTTYDQATILEVLEGKSYLHRCKVTFKDRVGDVIHRLDPGDGLEGYLKKLLTGVPKDPIFDQVFTFAKAEDPKMEVALQWVEASGESIRSYVNGIQTDQGGTHEQGLRSAVVRAVRTYMDISGTSTKGLKISADDIRDGVRAVLSVFVSDPQFKGQTKDRLNNPEVTSAVLGAVAPALEQFMLTNPSVSDGIVGRIIAGAKRRAAAEAATALVSRKKVTKRLNLPGKLADCSSNSAGESEIFIVEGDSAGGSAKQARDRHYQAILPLRGKVLNTEQASLKKIGGNREISDLVSALGCGVGKNIDLTKLRYGRVVILTDADSDGHHIAGLLLTFFFRYMTELLEAGHVYLGRPPLYRIRHGKKTEWAWTDDQRDQVLATVKGNTKAEITRFKGLGEMTPKQLKETTLDPESRTLFRVTVDNFDLADRAVKDCFGKDSRLRYQLVMERSGEADEVDL